MVEPHSSNFRMIKTKFLGVRIFRKFTVDPEIRLLLKKQSDQGLRSMPFPMHRLEVLLYGKTSL